MSKELKRRIHYNKGAYVFIENDKDSDYGYILESGELVLTSSNSIIERYQRKVEKGDIFGMITAFSEHPRLLCAYCLSDCEVIKIHKDMFMRLLHNQPHIAKKILSSFAELLLMYNKIVVEYISTGKEYTSEERLFLLCKYYYFAKDFNKALYIAKSYLSHYANGKFLEKVEKIHVMLKSRKLGLQIEPVVDGETLIYHDGQIIFSEFEAGDQLYVIKEGFVKIVKYRSEREVLLSILSKGDIFGELAIISEKPRSATALCYKKAVLWPISSVSVYELIHDYPEIMKSIFIAISRRLWFNFIRYESKLYQKPVTRMYAFLENKLLEDKVDFKSDESHTFNFGIEELMRMNAVSQKELGYHFNDFLNNEQLSFNFGQTIIHCIKEFVSLVKFYKMRDNINDTVSYENEE